RSLRFLDIPWERGPLDPAELSSGWSQQHRLSHYQQALGYLRENGKLFACRCSRKKMNNQQSAGCVAGCRQQQIPLDSEAVSWRLLTDDLPAVSARFDFKVRPVNLPDAMRNFVVRRRDGI